MSLKIGDPVVRVDSAAKVTGQAAYAADLSFAGMLYGKVLGSPFAHARIKRVSTEKARALPGVRAVVTGKDFPHLHGECIINIPFLAMDKVRYIGEPVVAVAAEDIATAEYALRLVEVEYEELPAVFDAEEALRPGAPLVHENLAEYQAISAVKVIPDTNVCQDLVFDLGDVEKGFLQSDHIFEDRFTTPQVQHATIEPHGCVALVDATGRITVWGQNDSPHRARKEIAQALGIPQAKVRVVTGYVGGNFGGKGGLKPEAVAIALASKVRGRPVKVVFSREEVFKTVTRAGCVIYLKSGVRRDGTLVAREMRLIWDMGAYAEKGPTISLHASSLASGPYAIPNMRIVSLSVFTNKPMAGAMRGYGVPQVAFAYESQNDIIAEALRMSPFDFRMKNAADEGTSIPTKQRLYAVGMKECLKRVGMELYRESGSGREFEDKDLGYGHWVKGRGLACIMKSTKTPTVSAAYVKIDEDGSGSVVTSTVEVGQGAHTVLIQIAGDILGLPAERMTVSFADTDVTPYDTSTTASRSTFHMGNAVRLAAEDAKRQLLAMAAPLFRSERETLTLHDGRVRTPDGRSLSFAQVLKDTFGAGAGAAILGKGVYVPEDILGLEDIGKVKMEAFSSLAVFHSYAVLGAEVAVDLETGLVKLLRFVAAHDVGKAINPGNCRQQIEGALSMGLGYGLMEEYLWEEGKVLNADFLDYAIPTALDCPPAEIYLIEKAHPQGPYGAKGMGEMANAHTAPAIANAVCNACGVRLRDLPLKPSKILKELRAKRS